MENFGLRFIELVKTAKNKFPIAYLDYFELGRSGVGKFIATLDNDIERAEMVAVLWVDKKFRYLVDNSEGTAQVEPMYRTSWSQFGE